MRTALIHSMVSMQSVGAEIRKVLASCDESQVPALMNALGEIAAFRANYLSVLRHSTDIQDEHTRHAILRLLTETDRVIALARLAIHVRG